MSGGLSYGWRATFSGVKCGTPSVDPIPSSPPELEPQQYAVRSVVRAQE